MLAVATGAGAQSTTGSILGRVADPAQALVPGARAEARNEATGLVESGATNGLGRFLLAALPPGTYTLTVSKPNFATVHQTGLRLAIDQKIEIEITLALAAQTDSVTAAAALLQTQSAEIGEVIDTRQILDLPLLGRNFLDLARLAPGVAGGSGGNTLNLSVNGQREFADSILVDGIEVSSNRNNDTTIRPSVDAVDEFKVLTTGYGAEFGRASGAVVAVGTKSGTNQFHGSAYEFVRPNLTAARSFFETGASPLKQHNFGATLGAPVRKDRTFVFASYEGVRQRNAWSFLDSLPPANQIRYLPGGAVDLSGLKDPYTGNAIPIFDPYGYATTYSATPFPGNAIPANRVSAAGLAVLRNFFPMPTLPGIFNGWFDNFNSRQAYSYDSDTFSGRVDHVLSASDRLSATYYYGSFASHTGDRFAGAIPVAGGGDADYGDQENSRSQVVSISETHMDSRGWLNEARIGYTRYRLDQLSLLNNRDLASQFGLGNVDQPGSPQTSGFPDIFLGFGAQTGGSTYKPLHFLDGDYQLSDSLSLQRGAHTWKAGVQFRGLASNPFFSLFPTGFQFYGGPGLSLTGDPNYGFYNPSAFYYNGGSDIADLLLGLPYSVNIGQQLTNPGTRSWETSLYLQDTWQIAARLVLSYGLRYEYFTPWTETGNQLANFDLASGQLLLAGRGGNSAALLRPDRNDFAPRLGLAFRAGPHTVLRAGAGVYYTPESDAREDVLTKNYPFAVQQTFFNNIFGGLPFPYQLDAGVPRVVPPAAALTAASLSPAAILKAAGTTQNLYLIDPALETGYSLPYNFTLQQQFAANLSLEAAYVGSVSRKLPYAVGNLNAMGQLSPALGQVQALFSEGSANFQSAQLRVVRRLSHGASLLASYTFGKNLDNGPAPFNLGHNLNSHNWPQSATNLTLERAVADDDVRHNLMVSGLYELPFGRGHPILPQLHGWSQAVLGGWQINAILGRRTGLPVNVVRNSNLTGFQGLRPDVISGPNLPDSQRTLARYFDTAAFVTTRFTGSHKTDLGDAGRNLVRGPGFTNLDFSLFKELTPRERFKVELRFEFFNLANTPQFANPNGDMSQGDFGSITQTIGNARIVQFASKLRW